MKPTLGLVMLLRATFQLVFSVVIWGGLLFLSAGTFAWPRGWIHLGLWVGMFAVNAPILLWLNRDVLAARLKPKRSAERFDTILLVTFVPAMLAIPVVAGLDAVRFGWTSVAFGAVYAGAALLVLGDAVILWAMVVNPFSEKTVRIQTERGHHVITTGPYAVVRHPMYVGVVLMFLGMPLQLGSFWTFVPVALMVVLLIIRTVPEERLLRANLPGYEDYMHKTRFRLIPGIW